MIKAQKRELLGKKVKQLRAEGQVPASVYGPKRESANLLIDPKVFRKEFANVGYSKLFELQIDDAKGNQVLIKEIQQNPITDELLHVSFYEVDMAANITAEVPIEVIGESPAVQTSIGILITPVDTVNVQCLPGDLPSKLVIDITSFVEVGDSVKIGDIKLPTGVELASNMVDSTSVAYIAAPQKQIVEEEAEEGEEGEGAEGEEGEEGKEGESKEEESKG